MKTLRQLRISCCYRLIHYPDGAMELYNHESDPYEKDNLLAAGLENLGANILSICSALIDLLPNEPNPALEPSGLPDVFNMMHTKNNGKITIN